MRSNSNQNSINAKTIEQALKQQLLAHNRPLQHIQCLASTSSTNDDAKYYHQQGYQHVLCCALQQTHGRGQSKRQWFSPLGNIYLSLLTPLERDLDGRLALECALNIVNHPLWNEHNLQVKWPNDLYYGNAKWGGILIEPIDISTVVIGVGINRQLIDTPDLNQHTTDLSHILNQLPDMTDIIHAVYCALTDALQWFNHGSPNLNERFNRHATWLNQPVQLIQQHQTLYGYFSGIQTDGALLLDHGQHIKAYYQGSLRQVDEQSN